jgi:hypothetical protein
LPIDAICALDDNAMFPHIQKLIIQENFSLCMENLVSAMSHEHWAWNFASSHLCHGKILEGGRKLLQI